MRTSVKISWILPVVLLVFGHAESRGCHRVNVDGIDDDRITGTYYYRYDWHGRPAYVNECGSLQLFFFQSENVAYWLIGPQIGKASGYILAHDTAADPTLVEGAWKEYSSAAGKWVPSGVSIMCEEECAYLDVENSHLPRSMFGPYELVDNSESDAPTFRHYSQDIFIHKSSSDAANCSMWHFSDEIDGAYSYLFTQVKTDRPQIVRKWFAPTPGNQFRELQLKWTCLTQDEFDAVVLSRSVAAVVEATTAAAALEQETVTMVTAPEDEEVCGERQVSMGAAMVINAQPSLEGKWPFMVALLNPGGDVKCGGVLLNSRWILTAGHCISDTTPADERVLVGAIDTDEPKASSREHSIASAIIHPEFEWSSGAQFQLLHDVGLIELTEPVVMGTYVQPICLQKANQILGLPGATSNQISSHDFDNCFTAGWGERVYKSEVGGVLQDFHVTSFIEKVSCAKTYFRSYVSWVPTSQTVCVQNSNKARICRGDSGSPLMCHSAGKWYVTGVASWSLSACISWRTNYPSMYTTMPEYRDWILQTIS